MDPPGLADELHVETVWRLPRASACYEPQAGAPPVRARPPFEDNGHVTFGCFKPLHQGERRGARDLGRHPRGAAGGQNALCGRRRRRPPRCSPRPGRASAVSGCRSTACCSSPASRATTSSSTTASTSPSTPFPYNGGTTSLDTLYMGVPFVALEGAHSVSRVGMSVLMGVGLDELVARTPQAYVEVACALAPRPGPAAGDPRGPARALRRGPAHGPSRHGAGRRRGLPVDVAAAGSASRAGAAPSG